MSKNLDFLKGLVGQLKDAAASVLEDVKKNLGADVEEFIANVKDEGDFEDGKSMFKWRREAEAHFATQAKSSAELRSSTAEGFEAVEAELSEMRELVKSQGEALKQAGLWNPPAQLPEETM